MDETLDRQMASLQDVTRFLRAAGCRPAKGVQATLMQRDQEHAELRVIAWRGQLPTWYVTSVVRMRRARPEMLIDELIDLYRYFRRTRRRGRVTTRMS
jgi:hypothetical protein